MTERSLRRDQSLLLAASAIAFFLWLMPQTRVFLLPLVYLNTYIHEMCHALAAYVTGGTPTEIKVLQSGSGITPVIGGWMPVVASAGYVGSAVVGAGIIAIARTERGARTVFAVLALTLSVAMVVLVRGDSVGVIAGIGWIAALFLAARFLKGDWAIIGAQFIGIQQCLNALLSIFTLLQISTATELQSDAKIMEKATLIPAVGWALGWAVLSVFLLFITLRKAWRTKPREASPAYQPGR